MPYIHFLYNKIRNNNLFRNGILFTFFAFLNNGISFLLLVILAYFINPSEYGELNLFNTLVVLFSIIISLNTTGIISVDYFNYSSRDLKVLINAVLLITIGVAIFCSAGLLIYAPELKSFIGLSVKYQWLALLVCFCQVFNSINLDMWRLEERPIIYGIYSTAWGVLNFGITLVLVIAFHYGWLGRLYSQVAVAIVFFIISIFCLIHRKYLIAIFPSKLFFKNALLFGIPLIPHSTAFWIRQGLDRYIINYFHGTAQVGLFSFAYNFANVLNIVGLSFNATYSVYLYKNLAQNNEQTPLLFYKHIRMLTLFFAGLTIFLYLGLLIGIPWLMPQYKEGIPYLLPLCIAGFFQCVYYLYVNFLFYFKKTKHLMYITFGISLFHLALSFILTRYSVLCTAYISLISNALITFLVFLYSQKIYPVKFLSFQRKSRVY